MVYVFVSYFYSPDVSTPEHWMQRIAASAGILEDLATDNTVISIKQINYTGTYLDRGVQYHFIDANRKRTKFPFKYNAYIKSLRPDIVIINGLHHPLEALQLQMQLVANHSFFFTTMPNCLLTDSASMPSDWRPIMRMPTCSRQKVWAKTGSIAAI